MRWDEQISTKAARYTVVPRTLSFILFGNRVLLLRGAADKSLGAGKLNGVGGHVEAGEGILTSARREIREETGLATDDLSLRAIIHISEPHGDPGVLLFVFVGRSDSLEVHASREGSLAWYDLDELPSDELVDDLPMLLPRIVEQESDEILYGHYVPDATGKLAYHFRIAGISR
jgi:8-oxo-dGTP diphosphatase